SRELPHRRIDCVTRFPNQGLSQRVFESAEGVAQFLLRPLRFTEHGPASWQTAPLPIAPCSAVSGASEDHCHKSARGGSDLGGPTTPGVPYRDQPLELPAPVEHLPQRPSGRRDAARRNQARARRAAGREASLRTVGADAKRGGTRPPAGRADGRALRRRRFALHRPACPPRTARCTLEGLLRPGRCYRRLPVRAAAGRTGHVQAPGTAQPNQCRTRALCGLAMTP
ncbi:MAG: hypothetical protein QOF76_5086, partial [Solirubrobacteraceae bacterium]|nr:hypothetical protein [Solirubrobacteraceae bacterium]